MINHENLCSVYSLKIHKKHIMNNNETVEVEGKNLGWN